MKEDVLGSACPTHTLKTCEIYTEIFRENLKGKDLLKDLSVDVGTLLSISQSNRLGRCGLNLLV
jgi:hypothetical protein